MDRQYPAGRNIIFFGPVLDSGVATQHLEPVSIAASLMAAQGGASAQRVATLAPISVVADGQEDIEATGGVVASYDGGHAGAGTYRGAEG